ncbi:hypothetical protein [Jeotgalibacillus haloalkalitolerans]|uniref:TFIIB-type zinc ribbon-containing protein n=1 Tax=Jeotgalibacillus haloalkalitolerans TaxID=3104292 RepID=A0ABU5KNE8_9BACL|nr:hypothetical protein [Jeotgalibacillus sp. HH7-29]MDZ5712782.1 hypothetical protein [Jeotgalibacillus sp. HH7-29]
MDKEISIPTDSEGFYSLQCPHCKTRFKGYAGDHDSIDYIELYCPSCGLSSNKSSFTPKDVIDHAITIARNYIQQEFYNTLKKSTKGKNGLSFKGKKPRLETPKLLTEDEILEQIELHCCEKIIKVNIDQIASNVYCPYCGVN